MLTAFSTKKPRSSTNPFGIDPAKSNPLPYNWGSAPTANQNQSSGGPLPFDLSDSWEGWKTNNWKLQYDTLPWLRDNILFARSMEPQRQQAIQGQVNQLMNPEGTAAAFRGQQRGVARDEGAMLGQMLAQGNVANADALRQGASLDAANRGAGRSSDLDAYLQSPQGQQEAMQAIIAAINGAFNPQAMGAYQGITNTALGVEDWNLKNDMSRKKSSGGLGGILGSALGMMSGGGWGSILGSLFGGGGSSGVDDAVSAALGGAGGLGGYR
jgi:hypothetical protein